MARKILGTENTFRLVGIHKKKVMKLKQGKSAITICRMPYFSTLFLASPEVLISAKGHYPGSSYFCRGLLGVPWKDSILLLMPLHLFL